MVTRSVLVLCVIALGATACTSETSDGPTTSGEKISSWSEGSDVDGGELEEAGGRLLTTADARDGWVAALPAPLDATEVADADMDEVVLVAGAYPRCMERGTVEVDDDGRTIRFRVTVSPEDEGTLCEWSPVTLEVWAVDRDLVADDVELVGP